jgi:prepilin peptidase CpaA
MHPLMNLLPEVNPLEYVDWISIIVALGTACIAAVTDIWKLRVYNWLTFPVFFSGLAYQALVHGSSGVGSGLLGATLGFAILLAPHMLGLMGAGDVKLMAALGAWLGGAMIVCVFAASSLVAGVYAAVLIIYRGKLVESWATVRLVVRRLLVFPSHTLREDLVEQLTASPDRRLRVIPFGAMVPAGIVGSLLWLSCAG